jgi:hypothetical protein
VFCRLGTLVWGALGLFHLWLLAQQVWSGQFDSAESVRWALALGLAGGLMALRRRGGSLLRDRRSTAIWVLVALLHGPALANRTDLAMQALAEAPAVVAQVACAATGLAVMLAWMVLRRPGLRQASSTSAGVDRPTPARLLAPRFGVALLPRPPPVG